MQDNGSNAEHHEWEFSTDRLAYGLFQVNIQTHVKVNGNRIAIDTCRRALFFKWGKQSDSFDVMDVQKVTLQKKVAKLNIVLIVLGLLMVLTGNWWGLLTVLPAVFFMHDKYLLIQHKNGGFRIYDAERIGANRAANEFFDYIQARNPQAMAIIRG